MEKSSQLHNFDLPSDLSWGSQKLLKCMKVPVVDADGSSDSDEYFNNVAVEHPHAETQEFDSLPRGRSKRDVPRGRIWQPRKAAPKRSDKRSESRVIDEISETRKKLMMEYQTDIGKLKERIRRNKSSDDDFPPIKASPFLFTGEGSSLQVNSKSKVNMPPRPPRVGIDAEVDDPNSEKKSMRLRRNLEKQEERPKFSISLSRKEIEEDFIAMTGKKPPRKPNRLPKNVQMELNALFPGSQLVDVHPDRYKVNENGKN